MQHEIFWPIYLMALAMIIFLIIDKVRRALNKTRIRRFDFPAKWVRILEKNVPVYKSLPLNLQEHHQDLVMQFIEDKNFEACGGLDDVTDEIKVTIAGNAVIPVLGRHSDIYRRVRSVLIYPSSFFKEDRENEGMRLGDAWPASAVVLAWDAANRSARDVREGFTAAIEEFTRKLDQAAGPVNGKPVPRHAGGALYAPWAEVLGTESKNHHQVTANAEEPDLGGDGGDSGESENSAEFLAVATEAFFDRARVLEKTRPELYGKMRAYYKVDPARWGRGGGRAAGFAKVSKGTKNKG